jgi:hypothetical protein
MQHAQTPATEADTLKTRTIHGPSAPFDRRCDALRIASSLPQARGSHPHDAPDQLHAALVSLALDDPLLHHGRMSDVDE